MNGETKSSDKGFASSPCTEDFNAIAGLVSIIVPMYNVAAFLPETLDRIRQQTYTHWECVCVDDGSTDDSAEIVQHVMDEDPRFRLIRQKNAGAAAARNTGMREIRGEFLAFVDSDDLLKPEMLETCIGRLHADGSDVCAFNVSALYADRVELNHWPIPADKSNMCVTPTEMQGRLFTCICAFSVNKVYRTKMIKDENLSFPSNLQRCEDASFAVLALALAKRISFADTSLYLYRQQREGSQTLGMSKPGVCLDFVESCAISWRSLREKNLLHLYGTDNILHTLSISFYYFTHLPNVGYTMRAIRKVEKLLRGNLNELKQCCYPLPPAVQQDIASQLYKLICFGYKHAMSRTRNIVVKCYLRVRLSFYRISHKQARHLTH